MKQTLLPILLIISLPLVASSGAPVKGKCEGPEQLAIDSQLKEVAALFRENQQLSDEDPAKVHGNADDVLLYLAKKNDLKLATLFFQRLGANAAAVTIGRSESVSAAAEPVPASQWPEVSPEQERKNSQQKMVRDIPDSYKMPSFFTANNSQRLFGEDTREINFVLSSKKPSAASHPEAEVKTGASVAVIPKGSSSAAAAAVSRSVVSHSEYDVKTGSSFAAVPIASSSAAADEKECKAQRMNFAEWVQRGSEDDQIRQVELARFMSLLANVTPEEWEHPVWKGNVGLFTRILLGAVDLKEPFADHLNVMYWLIQRANINPRPQARIRAYKNNEAIDIVFERMCKDSSEYLNKYDPTVGMVPTLIMEAARAGHLKWMTLLVKYGADPCRSSPCWGGDALCYMGNPSDQEPMVPRTNQDTVHRLLIFGLLLCDKGIGNTPLMHHMGRYYGDYRFACDMLYTLGVNLRTFGAAPLNVRDLAILVRNNWSYRRYVPGEDPFKHLAQMNPESFDCATWRWPYESRDVSKGMEVLRRTKRMSGVLSRFEEMNNKLESECKQHRADETFQGMVSDQLKKLKMVFQHGVFKGRPGYEVLYNPLLPIINDYVGLTLFSAQKDPLLAEAVEALERRRQAAAAAAPPKQ